MGIDSIGESTPRKLPDPFPTTAPPHNNRTSNPTPNQFSWHSDIDNADIDTEMEDFMKIDTDSTDITTDTNTNDDDSDSTSKTNSTNNNEAETTQKTTHANITTRPDNISNTTHLKRPSTHTRDTNNDTTLKLLFMTNDERQFIREEEWQTIPKKQTKAGRANRKDNPSNPHAPKISDGNPDIDTVMAHNDTNSTSNQSNRKPPPTYTQPPTADMDLEIQKRSKHLSFSPHKDVFEYDKTNDPTDTHPNNHHFTINNPKNQFYTKNTNKYTQELEKTLKQKNPITNITWTPIRLSWLDAGIDKESSIANNIKDDNNPEDDILLANNPITYFIANFIEAIQKINPTSTFKSSKHEITLTPTTLRQRWTTNGIKKVFNYTYWNNKFVTTLWIQLDDQELHLLRRPLQPFLRPHNAFIEPHVNPMECVTTTLQGWYCGQYHPDATNLNSFQDDINNRIKEKYDSDPEYYNEHI